MKYARILEFALGALFIASAALKALDVYSFAIQVSYYGIVKEPAATQAVAYLMIGIESLLGAALLAGWRFGGTTFAATGGLLVVFTAVIAYGWAFKGLKDCGCFGAYITMGPAASIAKNVVLLAVLVVAWRGLRRVASSTDAADSERTDPPAASALRRQFLYALAGLCVVALAFIVGKDAPAQNTTVITPTSAETPFAAFVPDLGGAPVPLAKGTFLVAMLSASCHHCEAAVELLNELAEMPNVPQVVALVGGTQDELISFVNSTAPQFPVQRLDMLPFMTLIGNAPPRFYVITDGAEVRHLDELEATFEQLLEFAIKDGETDSSTDQNPAQ